MDSSLLGRAVLQERLYYSRIVQYSCEAPRVIFVVLYCAIAMLRPACRGMSVYELSIHRSVCLKRSDDLPGQVTTANLAKKTRFSSHLAKKKRLEKYKCMYFVQRSWSKRPLNYSPFLKNNNELKHRGWYAWEKMCQLSILFRKLNAKKLFMLI